VKKLFSVVILMLFASVSVLSGCDLVTINEAKYYSTVVMEVGDTEITKHELINRFNNIGSQYIEEGYSVDEAMQYTIDSMVNRELILTRAHEEVGELTQAQKNDVWQEVYDSVNSRLEEYEGQIRSEWNVSYLPEETEEETEEETFDVYEPYEKKVIMVNDEFVRVQEPEEPAEEPIGDFVREQFKSNIDEQASGVTYEEVQEEAWDRYIRDLINSESWKNVGTVESEVFNRELERLYDIYEGNKYIELIEKHFNFNLEINNQAITDKYIELVQDSFAKYNIDMDAYHEAMGDEAGKVYYHPNSGEEYIYVSHVLIDYSDEQNELLDTYSEQLESGEIDQVTYDGLVEDVQNNISAKARNEEGVEVGDEKSATEILSEIEYGLNSVGTDVELRAEKFNEFIYKYNQDPGMFNSETPYVINLDTSVEDKMVEEFANTSRELYQTGEGSLSELVLTEFGYHIIFYSNPVQNIINYDNLLNITPEALYNTPLSPGLNKSMYDKMFETVNERAFSNYQVSLINEMKSLIEVTIYESRYDDLVE